jgi:hypothetical protein
MVLVSDQVSTMLPITTPQGKSETSVVRYKILSRITNVIGDGRADASPIRIEKIKKHGRVWQTTPDGSTKSTHIRPPESPPPLSPSKSTEGTGRRDTSQVWTSQKSPSPRRPTPPRPPSPQPAIDSPLTS